MAETRGDHIVIGHFRYVDDTKQAIVRLKQGGFSDLQLFSPVPNHDLEEELYREKPRSAVRRFTLIGAVTGCLGAFLMTIWMSHDWPLRTSAKPIISIPAFVVIGFECTVLLGCIFTLLGMLHLNRLPNIFAAPGYRPNFSKDVFGLVARVTKEKTEQVKTELKKAGAFEVEVEYAR